MSDQYLKLRRSSVPGKVPGIEQLEFGEIALNTYDGLAYMKKSGSAGEEIIQIGGVSSNTGNFTGSFSGSVVGLGQFTGSFSGSLSGSFYGSASYADTASYALSASYFLTSSVTSASYARTASYVNPLYQDVQITGSLYVTQSHISTVDWIDFTIDPQPDPPHLEGRIHWDVDRKTLKLDTEQADFSIDTGHVNVLRGKNNNSYALTPGMVIYIDGNAGQFATFTTASWENDPNSAYSIGIIPQTINPNNSGYAIIQGEISGINTNAYPPGTLLYLSASGQYTDQKPQAPLHTVRLGQVVVQATDGKLQVKIDNGYEIDELHDVLVTNATHGDLLVRSASIWINSKQLSGSYGLTGSFSISGSGIIGTSSFATSASYARTASYVDTALTASYFITSSVTSASYASTASYVVNALTASYFITSSVTSASYARTASYVDTALTASYFITSSVTSASYARSSSLAQTASYFITSSVTSASYAATASYVVNALTASYFITSSVTSASYASTASYVVNSLTASYFITSSVTSASYARTASYVDTALTASYFITSSVTSASYARSSSLAQTASYFITSSVTSASYAATASYVVNALTASYFITSSVTSASYAATASFVTGSSFTSANPVLSSSYALTSSFAWTASVALNAVGSVGGSGTVNRISKFVGATTLGNSQIFDDGTNIQITGSSIIFSGSNSTLRITGSVMSLGGFTGSLFGTSSWAINSLTASYFLTSSVTSASYARTASYVDTALTASYFITSSVTSASYARTASYVDTALTASYFITSSVTSASYARTASYVDTALTASYFITSSVTSASYARSSSLAQTASYFITSSVTSASYAATASYVVNALTASYFITSSVTSASYAATASYVTNALTASYFITSSVTSASYARTASYVDTALTASYFITSSVTSASYAISSSLAATASYITGSALNSSNLALSSSYAITASYALNAGGGGDITVADEGNAQGVATFLNFLGSGVTATVASSTASITITGGGGDSFPYTGSAIISGSLTVTGSLYVSGTLYGDGSGLTNLGFGNTRKLIQSTPATTWSFAHNMGEQYPAVTIYDSNTNVIVPGRIEAVDTNNLKVYFDIAQSGIAVAVVAGRVETGSLAKLEQTIAANTWSFAHNLGYRYAIIDVFDSAGDVLVPGRIETIDENNANIYFTIAQTGTAVAMVGGTALTSSYANTMTINGTSLSTQTNPDADTGTEIVATVYTGSYQSAFFDYVLNDGTNFRAGTVMSVWDNIGTVKYNDNSTDDIGNTTGVIFIVDINGDTAQLKVTTNSNNWNIKTFVRAL